jgi:hypothetical protein
MLQRVFRGIVGGLVLTGAALETYHSPNWIYFLVLVGLMLLQSGITDRCPLLWLLQKAGLKGCEQAEAPASTRLMVQPPQGGDLR